MCAVDQKGATMDPNGRADGRGIERLTAHDALCLLVGCMLTVLEEAPSDEERQRSLDGCIDLLKGVSTGLKD
jgi:hypothetical protein